MNPGTQLVSCVPNGPTPSSGDKTKDGSGSGASNAGGMAGQMGDPNVTNLVGVCSAINKNKAYYTAHPEAKEPAATKTFLDDALKSAGDLIAARDALFKGGAAADPDLTACGGQAVTMPSAGNATEQNALDAATQARNLSAGARGAAAAANAAKTSGNGATSAIDSMESVVTQDKAPASNDKVPGADILTTAESHLTNAVTILNAVGDKLKAPPPTIPPELQSGSDAPTYRQQLVAAQQSLVGFKANLDPVVAPDGNLSKQLGLLDQVAGTKGASGTNIPTLTNVVKTNAANKSAVDAYTKAAGAAPDAPAADPNAPKPGSDIQSTVDAITAANKAVTAAASSVQTYVNASSATGPQGDQVKAKANTDLGTAATAVKQMQATQTGALESIRKSIQGVDLPAAPAAQ